MIEFLYAVGIKRFSVKSFLNLWFLQSRKRFLILLFFQDKSFSTYTNTSYIWQSNTLVVKVSQCPNSRVIPIRPAFCQICRPTLKAFCPQGRDIVPGEERTLGISRRCSTYPQTRFVFEKTHQYGLVARKRCRFFGWIRVRIELATLREHGSWIGRFNT